MTHRPRCAAPPPEGNPHPDPLACGPGRGTTPSCPSADASATAGAPSTRSPSTPRRAALPSASPRSRPPSPLAPGACVAALDDSIAAVRLGAAAAAPTPDAAGTAGAFYSCGLRRGLRDRGRGRRRSRAPALGGDLEPLPHAGAVMGLRQITADNGSGPWRRSCSRRSASSACRRCAGRWAFPPTHHAPRRDRGARGRGRRGRDRARCGWTGTTGKCGRRRQDRCGARLLQEAPVAGRHLRVAPCVPFLGDTYTVVGRADGQRVPLRRGKGRGCSRACSR